MMRLPIYYSEHSPKAPPIQTSTWQYMVLWQLHKKRSGEWAECVAGPKGLANMTDRPIDVKVIATREKGNDRSSEKAMTVCLFMCRENRCSHLSFLSVPQR